MTHHEGLVIDVADSDVELEARWDKPESPTRVAVLCHPHPLQRGTMFAPLMQAITESLGHHDVAVLRFNFRGAGGSTGEHDGGDGEMDDIAAAVATAASSYPELPLGIAGWSFGAVTSLRWQARDANALPWVGIAPPVASSRSRPLPASGNLPPARRTIILGDRDQFATVADSERYAASIGAELRVLKGSDHFFYFREDRVAAWVAEGLSPLD